jgi:hypothetical protein
MYLVNDFMLGSIDYRCAEGSFTMSLRGAAVSNQNNPSSEIRFNTRIRIWKFYLSESTEGMHWWYQFHKYSETSI